MKRIPWTKQIDKIMAEFDFQRVARAMKQMHWTWCDVKGTPTVDRLREVALMLLRECRKKDRCALSTGGFVASCDLGVLTLTFRITETDGVDSL